MIYKKWGDGEKRAEATFLKEFEPRVFLGGAYQFRSKAMPPRMRIKNGTDITDLEASAVEDLASDYLPTSRYFMRLIRYQSSELFLSLLMASEPNQPALRFLSRTNFDALNKKIKKLSMKEIPNNSGWSISGKPLNFSEWASLKLVGRVADEVDDTISSFVAQEAKLLSDRTIFNAMKHGRASIDLKDQSVSISVENGGDWQELLQQTPIVSAMVWEEDTSRIGISKSIESVDAEADFQAIFIASRLMELLKNARLFQLGEWDGDVKLLNKLALDDRFFRINGMPVK